MDASDRRRLIAEEESDEEVPQEELTELHIPITTASTAFEAEPQDDDDDDEAEGANDDAGDDASTAEDRRRRDDRGSAASTNQDAEEEDQQALLDQVAAIVAATADEGDPEAAARLRGAAGATARSLEDPDFRRRVLINTWKCAPPHLSFFLILFLKY
jgi:hypothetical protein